MSYILEALKKAQAERQLGNAPTLHAAQPVVSALAASAASRKPLLVGLGAGALVVAAGAVFLWCAGPAPAPATRVAAVVPVSAPPAAGSPAAAPEDSLPYLQQLPEPVQREVPRVAFGGYMYSANPADRLLLVDKVLRHEGEEVAPGLILEKLLPRAAVMNYRGVRYRVSY